VTKEFLIGHLFWLFIAVLIIWVSGPDDNGPVVRWSTRDIIFGPNYGKKSAREGKRHVPDKAQAD
jgi:hypothetical protein